MKNTKTLTKEKITEKLKEQLGFSGLISEEITNNIFREIYNLTKQEGKVNLPNFGTWRVSYKNPRPGFNPKTGESVEISPRNVLRFLPSRSFKEKINNDRIK